MKKQSVNKAALVRWMIVGFIFCMSGVLMQIIAPAFPNSAIVTGIVFFVLMLGFGAAICMLRNAIRKERTAAIREEVHRE